MRSMTEGAESQLTTLRRSTQNEALESYISCLVKLLVRRSVASIRNYLHSDFFIKNHVHVLSCSQIYRARAHA